MGTIINLTVKVVHLTCNTSILNYYYYEYEIYNLNQKIKVKKCCTLYTRWLLVLVLHVVQLY